MRRQIGFLLAAVLLSAAAARADQGQPPTLLGVRVGFGDCYKAGLWTPVEVTLCGGREALSGRLRLTVPDGEGAASRVVSPAERPIALRPGRETTARLCVRFGRVSSPLLAEFLVDDRVVVRKTYEASTVANADHFAKAIQSRPLIVCIGDVAKTVEEAAMLGGAEPERRAAVGWLDDPRHLPDQWYGYEGVDALVLSTSKAERYATLAPESPQMEALEQWVRMGGKLVFCAGAQAARTLDKDSPWARFAPGRFQEMVSLRQTGALETFAGSAIPIPQAARGEAPLRVPRLAGVEGLIEAREADLPLVVRTARGFGQIVFLAGDLDGPPLASWPDQSRLVARLLGLPTSRTADEEQRSGGMWFGYADMAGQLRSALDQFAGVRLVPFWLVATLVVVYILLIGPVDYFFLRKVVGRMQWTWLTFPAIVLVFSAAAYVLAYRLKGNELRVNQIDLIDVDMASGQVRGTSWMNLFSPTTRSFELSVQPGVRPGKPAPDARASVLMAWLGLPGKGLGGMDPQTASPVTWRDPYDFSPALNAMRGLPIQVWSSRSLTARWCDTIVAGDAGSKLADDEQGLSGTVVNESPLPLSKCILAYDRWVYELDTLAPGQSIELSDTLRRSDLRTFLTGRRLVEGVDAKYVQETAVYDQASTDAAYVLRMMMFYEAAGGQRYTGLTNDYQQFVDGSELLTSGRAVLVGQAADAEPMGRGAAELRNDGRPIGDGPQDRHAVFYRFVLPVKKSN